MSTAKTPLIPSGMDGDHIEAFTPGWCWNLALELASREGFHLVGIVTGNGVVQHVAVMQAGGFVLDIEGLWNAEEWQAAWSYSMDLPVAVRFVTEADMHPDQIEGLEDTEWDGRSITQIADQLLQHLGI